MTHLVTEKCIKCKYTTCVSVCPVDCFHEGKNMLVINPDECIDCGVCIDECPVKAIIPDTSLNDLQDLQMLQVNKCSSQKWPVITKEKPQLVNAHKFKDVKNKYLKFFEENV